MLNPIRAAMLTALAGLASYSVQAGTLTGLDVGYPSMPGSVIETTDGNGKTVYTVAGGGSDIWGAFDNFYYAYTQVTNDFDYVVKITSHIGNSGDGGWSKAELMARLDDGLGIPQGGDPFIANMQNRPASDTANGAPGGVNHRGPQWRAVRDNQCSWTTPAPEYRPTGTNDWLRLERVGNVIYMYTGNDGKTWNMYNPYAPQGWDTSGSWPAGTDNSGVSVFTNAWPSTILLGLAVTAHNDLDLSTVVFTDFGPYTPVPITITTPPPATLSVAQNDPLTLSVAATGDPVHYQWIKDGTAIPQAVDSSFKIGRVQLSDAGKYTVRVFGGGKAFTSDTVLTVTADTTPPTAVKAITDVTFTSIVLTYSEPVSDTALKASNYSLDQGLILSSVVTRVNAETVTLTTTTKMAEGGRYTLTINGVQDMAGTPNSIAANTQVQVRTLAWVAGMVTHKKYNNFTDGQGGTPDGLFNDPRFPAASDRVDYMTSFEYPANGSGRNAAADPARNYFDTLEGYFIPPANGNYVFFTAGADRWWLYLSTDENPANRLMVAAEPGGWTDPRGWTTTHDQDPARHRTDQSTYNVWPTAPTITLEKGKKYYMLEVHHDPSWCGADDFSATYIMEGDLDPVAGSAPTITSSVIGTYVDPSGISLSITQQPASVSILENVSPTFSVAISSSWSTPTYQWQKAPAGGAFTDIPGATKATYNSTPLTISDNGSRFRVNVSVPGTTLASDEAVVTVTSDKVPPTLVSALRMFMDDTQVTVVFSELVDPASANTAINYQINNGITVSAAALNADGRSVVLTTSAIAKGTVNTLTVSIVKDLAGNPIAANSQIAIGFQRGGLFVVAGTDPVTLNVSDGLVRDHLLSKGYYLQIVGARSDDVSMATGKDIIVISSTIASGDVAGTYKNVAVPVFEAEQAIQDDMAMTTVTGTADRGTTGGQTQIDIVNPSHPMAAGLPAGPVTIVTASSEFPWGQPDANAQVVARIVGTADHACIYGYDKGAILTDGTAAPERRVLFCMTDNVFAAFNPTGVQLFDAAINWAQSLAAPITTPTMSLQPTAQGWNITYTGVLYSADSPNGAWTAVLGASSPYPLVTTGSQKFFRAKAQ